MSSQRFVLPLTLCSFWPERQDAAMTMPDGYGADQVVHFPACTAKPEPQLTETQRLRRTPMKGLFSFIVSPDGTVVDVSAVYSNNEEFTKACDEAIRHWAFTPMSINGKPAWCRMQVPIAWNG